MDNNHIKEYWQLCQNVRDSGKFTEGVALHKSDTDTMAVFGNVIVCDGTDTLREWVENVAIFRSGKNDTHAGFSSAAEDFFEQLRPLLKTKKNWIFCGHSRGGAISQAVALLVAQSGYGYSCQVVTFGSPKVGGKRFLSLMAKYAITHIRVVMDGDPIQRWPLWWKHYETDLVDVPNKETSKIKKHLNYGDWL